MKLRRDPLGSMRRLAIATILPLFLNYSQGAQWQALSGHVPKPVAAGLQPLGALAGTTHLRIAITLPVRNQNNLKTLLQQIYDPASANYHQYLTPQQFADQFGPTAADYQALQAYAGSNGVAVAGTHPNRTVLDLDMSITDIEKLFRVHMKVYKHPTENRNFFAPDTEPSIAAPVPILHIDGLTDYIKAQPASHFKSAAELSARPAGTPAGTGSGPFGTYLGYDFRDAYMPGVTLDGNGQSMALFELDGYYPADIASYESQAKVPTVPVNNILVDGFNGIPFTSSGNGECSLDIEMAIDMAPGLSSILVYETTNGAGLSYFTDTLNRIATDDAAKQISSSWLIGDSPAWDQIYQQYALQGQTFLQASGDNGAFVWSDTTQQQTDTPYATLVGGTTLTTSGPLSGYSSETVWNWNSTGGGTDGSGGGISPNYTIPSWQTGISMKNNSGSTVWRDIPDVALTADNIWVISQQGQGGSFGGTSCAAPLWAGVVALMNQQAARVSKPAVGFLNPTIYAIAKGPLYGSTLHDIITGNDTNAASPDQFYATRGYDLTTGWGTPTGSNLINAVVPNAVAPILAVATNIISGGNGNGVIDFDECDNLTILLTNEGNAAATGITGVLSSLTPGVIVAQTTSAFPDMPIHDVGSSITAFTISTVPDFVCGTPVDLQLVVKSQQNVETNFIELSSGQVGSPYTLTNNYSSLPSPGLPIPVNFTGITNSIAVSGLDSAGQITVSVWLSALYDSGITMKLISPNGTSVLLTENNGGLGANYGEGCGAGSATTFADDAPQSITGGSPPYIGSFQPMQPLSVFNLATGTNLNGNWQLNVVDQYPGDTAGLECWELTILPEICQDGGGGCPGADLSLTMNSIPSQVVVGNNFVYQLVVSNAGPGAASNVLVSQTLPANVLFVAATNYPVSASVSSVSNLNLTIGSIPVYGVATIDVVVNASQFAQGLLTSIATVSSTTADANPDNNTASATTLVSLPSADLAVSMSANPPNVLAGAPLTYTIVATNNGPATAKSTELNVFLPANFNVTSISASQGSELGGGSSGSLSFDLGALPPDTNAVVTIVGLPTTTGNLTASAQVLILDSTEIDPDQLNNNASATVTVGPSADLAVTASVNPITVLSGSNYTYIATVVNNGPSTATTVSFNQTIPGGATVVSTSQPVTVTNGVINWNIGTLGAGASATITNVLRAPTLLGGVLSNALTSTINVFGQPGDPYPNNNVVILTNVVMPPLVIPVVVSATLVSVANQPSDGSVHPGGTVTVEFNIQNQGNIPTTNLVATLEATGGVELPSGSQNYGTLAPDATVGRVFSFTAQSANGGTVVATLALHDAISNYPPAQFTFYMPNVYTFWNTNIIFIPDTRYVPEPDQGPAGPYPATVMASNISGYVSDVTLTLSNANHTYPHDISLLVVGPTGQNSILMSSAAAYSSMSDATLTFDENAANPAPASGPMVTGEYFPTNYNPSIYFPTNAPQGPYNTNLSIFTGLSANGNWSLYAYDDSPGDAGAISNGWSVTITTITPVNPEADLGVTLQASSNQMVLGGVLTNYLSITNYGPFPAAAYLTNTFSSGVAFVTNLSPLTNYVLSGDSIVYSLGTLNPGEGLAFTNLVTAIGGGAQTITVSAGSPVADPNLANNSAGLSFSVSEPTADISASIAVTNSVVVGSNLSYTLSVHNAGPSNAVEVVGTFPLTNLTYVSSVPAGVASEVGNTLVCDFGTIAVGTTANVTLTVTPQLVGIMTNIWSVTAATIPTNAAATTNVTVTLPVPIIVADGATLLTQGGGYNNGAINPNETVTVAFTLANVGVAPTTNLVATLQGGNGISPGTMSATYGQILPGSAVTQPFTFVAQGAPGATVTATLALTDGANSLGSVAFPFMIPLATNYSSSSGIIIPDVGPATPYPSEILVSGLSRVISQVTASLNGFSHTFPHDVNVMLVGPTGQELMLMAHTGGPYSVTNLELTFADSASASLPTTQLSGGTYLPTDLAPYDVLPGFSTAGPSGGMSVFNGLTPNGTWSLYVYDDTPGNAGQINKGWSLALTAVDPVNPVARLAATMIHAPDPVYSGNYLSYEITVTNLGPDVASNVVISDTLPASLVFSSATVSQGSYTVNNSFVRCNLGSISAGASATAVINGLAEASPVALNTTNVNNYVQYQLKAQSPQSRYVSAGTIVNSATVTTSDTELYLADTTASNSAQLSAPLFGLLATNLPTGLQLTLVGQASQNYIIQVSTNLVKWSTVVNTTTDLNGSYIYTDSSANSADRFYRAVLMPQ